MQETEILCQPLVTITTARAIFANTTYAVANITSVRSITVPKPLAFVILGVLILGICLLMSWTLAGILIALACAIVYAVVPARHIVVLATAGSEHQAWTSRKPEDAAAIVAALNQAIISRG